MDEFFAHYASPYYDPVKRKEYYERTKVLKGERDAKKLTDTQNDVFRVAQDNIKTQRKNELDTATTQRDARLAEIRKKSEETIARINEKLEEKLKSISAGLKIPTNASPKLRAFLTKQQKIQSASAKAEASKERSRLASELRVAISSARDTYAKGRKAANDKYETTIESEREAIRAQVK